MFLVPVSHRASHLARQFDRLCDARFERFLATAVQGSDAVRSPALDVSESDSAYTVSLDLPGVAKEELKVSIDGRKVSIEAQARKEEEKTEGERVVYRERSSSSWARSFSVAAEIDQAASSAKLENGVLTLVLTKLAKPASTQLTIN